MRQGERVRDVYGVCGEQKGRWKVKIIRFFRNGNMAMSWKLSFLIITISYNTHTQTDHCWKQSHIVIIVCVLLATLWILLFSWPAKATWKWFMGWRLRRFHPALPTLHSTQTTEGGAVYQRYRGTRIPYRFLCSLFCYISPCHCRLPRAAAASGIPKWRTRVISRFEWHWQ